LKGIKVDSPNPSRWQLRHTLAAAALFVVFVFFVFSNRPGEATSTGNNHPLPLLEAQEGRLENKNLYCARVRESFAAITIVAVSPDPKGITAETVKECLASITKSTPYRPIAPRKYGLESLLVGRGNGGPIWCSGIMPMDGPSSFMFKVPEKVLYRNQDITDCFKSAAPVFGSKYNPT
jgi:hypothetical protein